jgi:hypothetical protein
MIIPELQEGGMGDLILSGDAPALQLLLCAALCKAVRVTLTDGKAVIALPVSGRDGDEMVAYVSPTIGGWRISDMGTSMMRLSYENDLNKLFTGASGKLLETILNESGMTEDDGELFVDVPADALSRGLFTFSQGLARIEDMTSKRAFESSPTSSPKPTAAVKCTQYL